MITPRGVKIRFTSVKTALSKTGLPELDYALNPYIGCYHSCIYCYARLYTRDRDVSEKWGEVVVVKTNLLSILAREVQKYPPGIVGIGTITDPYQPIEAIYRLTRRSIELLLKKNFATSIQTKNPLVLRDLDLFKTHREQVDVGLTITSLNEDIRRFIEPKTPPYNARVEALRKLSLHGVKTWIFYGPVIPGLNDDEETIIQIVELARETKSTLYYDPIHVKPFLLNPNHQLYNYITGKTRDWWIRVSKKILDYCIEHHVHCKPGFTGNSVNKV